MTKCGDGRDDDGGVGKRKGVSGDTCIHSVSCWVCLFIYTFVLFRRGEEVLYVTGWMNT